MSSRLFSFLALSAVLSVPVCARADSGSFSIPEPISAKVPAVGEAVPSGDTGAQERKTVKEWTIMVFGNGKNSLEPYIFQDMNEMEKVGSTEKMNVVVEAGMSGGEFDENNEVPSGQIWKGVRRYYIEKDRSTKKISSPMIENLGDKDMGDYREVVDFVKWAKRTYPAKKYMLILWNHGSGWLKSRGIASVPGRGISYDDDTGNHINTPEMAELLRLSGGVDVYASDACLMQMAEVDYEIRNYAKYIVGSEETEPGDGYTYDIFLGAVAKRPEMPAGALSAAAVASYAKHYEKQNTGYTQSAVNSAALPGFVGLTNAFTKAFINSGDKELGREARKYALAFDTPENKDMCDFVRYAVSKTSDAGLKAAGTDLLRYIKQKLVVSSRSKDNPQTSYSSATLLSKAGGIAVYLPFSIEEGYSELAWVKATDWVNFIEWLNSAD